jgi:hypothetical protein
MSELSSEKRAKMINEKGGKMFNSMYIPLLTLAVLKLVVSWQCKHHVPRLIWPLSLIIPHP